MLGRIWLATPSEITRSARKYRTIIKTRKKGIKWQKDKKCRTKVPQEEV